MFKHTKILTASIILIVGLVFAAYSIPRDTINQWSAGTDALGLTLQTDGALVGQVDNANDLGSSDIGFKNAYIGTLAADDITVSGDIRVSSILGIGVAEGLTVTTHTAITPTGSFILIRSTSTGASAGNVSVLAVPAIDATNFQEGDILVITSTQSVSGMTLTEGSAYDLQLGASTRTIELYDVLTLVYCSSSTVAGSSWFQEVSFADN